jgi:hypothetical protein
VVKDFSNLRHEDGEGGRILQKSGDTTKFSHKKIRIFSLQEISRYNQRPGDSSSLRYPQAKQTDPNLIFESVLCDADRSKRFHRRFVPEVK